MDSAETVTFWIARCAEGDQDAATRLWERCFGPMLEFARRRLAGSARQSADEEDVALSAFGSFFEGLKNGDFPLLGHREDLWGLLVTITARKAADLIRHAHRQKRGGGGVVNEGALERAADSTASPGLDQFPGREPSPEFTAQMNEACGQLLDALGDDTLRRIAVCKLDGYRDAEVAAKLGIAQRSVERKLKMIRDLWAREVPS